MSEKHETENRILAAGVIVKIGGIPFRLEKDTIVSSHPANFAAAAEAAIFPQMRPVCVETGQGSTLTQ